MPSEIYETPPAAAPEDKGASRTTHSIGAAPLLLETDFFRRSLAGASRTDTVGSLYPLRTPAKVTVAPKLSTG
jgi:hypothetical protein